MRRDQRGDPPQQIRIPFVVEVGPHASQQQIAGEPRRSGRARADHRAELGSGGIGRGEVAAGPARVPARIAEQDAAVRLGEAREIERRGVEHEGRIGPEGPAEMLAEPIVAAAARTGEHQLDPIVRDERLEHVAQRRSETLRGAAGGARLRDSVEQCGDPLGPVAMGAVGAVPLACEPAEGRREPLRREAKHHEIHAAIAAGLETGHQQEPDVPPAEANRQRGRRGIAGVANDLLQNGELTGLHLRRREGDAEVVLGECLGTEQHDATGMGIEPEAEQVVRNVGGQGVGECLVPGRERLGVPDASIQAKDRNERLARRGRESVAGEPGVGGIHAASNGQEACRAANQRNTMRLPALITSSAGVLRCGGTPPRVLRVLLHPAGA